MTVTYKQRPADFVVEEVSVDGDINSIEGFRPSVQPPRSGSYIAFTMVKEGLSTVQAIDRLAQHLGVNRSAFSYAGLKDSRAITAQAVHISRKHLGTVREVDLKSLRLVDPRVASRRLHPGALWGNYFRVRVEPQGRVTQTDLDRARATLGDSGIINYFDHQRFGRRMNLHQVGFLLATGQEQAAFEEFVLASNSLESASIRDTRRQAGELWPDRRAIDELYRRTSSRSLDQEIAALDHIGGSGDYSRLWELPLVSEFSIRAWVAYLFNLAVSVASTRSVSEVPLFEPSRSTVNFYERVCGSQVIPPVLSPAAISHLTVGMRATVIWPVDCHFQMEGSRPLLRFALQKGAYATALLRSIFHPREGRSSSEPGHRASPTQSRRRPQGAVR